MAFEAYSVAVKLSLINNVSSGLLLISKNLQSANMDAKSLQGSIASIGKQMAIGGAMVAGGLAIALLFKAPLKEAAAYQNALARFQQMNLGDAINKDADSMARHANAFGTSATEMMNTLRDLHAAFGSYEEAKQFAPKVAALNAANRTIYGEGHGVDEGETKALAKVIEMRGGTVNTAAFNRELDVMQRMKNATGGVIDAKILRAFMSTAGIAGRSLSDTGLQNLSGLIVEMGGNRAGTALMSMYQNLVAGRTTKKAMGEIQGLGLGQIAEVMQGHIGKSKQTTAVLKNIKGEDELKANPVGWIKDVLLPQFKSKGITDQSTILKTINDILSNRTGANLASISATQLSVMMKDANNAKNAHGVDATITDAKNTLQGKITDLTAKWSNVMLELGVVVLPMAISEAQNLIPMLQSLSTFIQKHHAAVKVFTGALLGLSAFLVTGGLVNMLWAAGRGFGLLYTVFGKWPGILNTVLVGAGRAGEAVLWFGSKLAPLAPFIYGFMQAFIAPVKLLGQAILFAGRALLFTGIGALLTGVGIAAYFIWKNWDSILPRLKTIWSAITDGIMSMWNGIKALFGLGGTSPDPKRPDKHFVASAGPHMMQVHTQVNLDGRKVGQIVSTHQGRWANIPYSGSGADAGLAMPLTNTR